MRKLIIMNGLPGSGKNTIGKMISIEQDAVFFGYGHIDNDYNRNIVETYAGDDLDLEGRNLVGAIKISHHRNLIEVAIDKATQGNTVVICSPFYEWLLKPKHLIDVIQKAESYGVEVEFIWVDTELEKTKERLLSKAIINDKWKINNWDRYSESIRNITSVQDFNYTSRDIKYPSIDMKYFNVYDNNENIIIPDEILEFETECTQFMDKIKY